MQFEKWFQIDLDRPRAHPVDLGFPVFSGDNDSVRVGVEVMRNGVAQSISGTVSGHIILPSGATVPTTSINADSDGNRAWIDLPESAFALQGRIQLAIRVTDGTTKTVLLSASATVRLTETTTAYDPSNEVPTSSEMIDAYQHCLDAYSENTHPVSYDTENPQTLSDAEKAQARQNISAADAGLVNALHGLVDYDYGTAYTDTGFLNSRLNTRLVFNGSIAQGGTATKYLLTGTVKSFVSSFPSTPTEGVTLIDGHTYRLRVIPVSGTLTNVDGYLFPRWFAPGQSGVSPQGDTSHDAEGYSDLTYSSTDYPDGILAAVAVRKNTTGAVADNYIVEVVVEDITREIHHVPPVPLTNGTYTLKATVTNGVPVYAWVSDGGASLLSTPLTLTGGETE